MRASLLFLLNLALFFNVNYFVPSTTIIIPERYYENDVTEGAHRTGDQGLLDEDGHLRLTGRLKEIINRGGEKISSREVDEILLDHPRKASPTRFSSSLFTALTASRLAPS